MYHRIIDFSYTFQDVIYTLYADTLRSCCMIIDLTLPVYPGMPVYPGDSNVVFRPALVHEKDGFSVHELRMGTHTGTHIDAPCHSDPHGAPADAPEVLDACVGDAVLIDISMRLRGNKILLQHLETALSSIPQGGRVLIATGWSSRFGNENYYTCHPSLSDEVADELIRREIRLLGIDMPSLHITRDDVIHDKLLSAGIVIVESLTNLAALKKRHVFFSAAPLRLLGLDGSPVRAYAVVPNECTHG